MYHVSDTIHNTNGKDYIIIAINSRLDRVLLVQKGTDEPRYIGAWGLCKSVYEDGWSWSNGHYFMGDLEAAVNYVNGKE